MDAGWDCGMRHSDISITVLVARRFLPAVPSAVFLAFIFPARRGDVWHLRHSPGGDWRSPAGDAVAGRWRAAALRLYHYAVYRT